MPSNPYDIICEILGSPAQAMQNPANAEYLCPFRNVTCTKRSQRSDGPFPICTIFRRNRGCSIEPIIVCPRRLYAADIFNDVIKHCWPGSPPKNPVIVHEIKLGEVGNVDMVIADLSEDGNKVNNFVSIELQAIDITGSYEPAYSSIVLGSPLRRKPTYSFNYKNVQKRFITQLIDKGFCHHHWGTKIIAVIQDAIYDRLRSKIDFPEVGIEQSNGTYILFSATSIGCASH